MIFLLPTRKLKNSTCVELRTFYGPCMCSSSRGILEKFVGRKLTRGTEETSKAVLQI